MLFVGGGQQVDEHTDNLTPARQAYAAQDWAAAASQFDAVAADRLTVDDYDRASRQWHPGSGLV